MFSLFLCALSPSALSTFFEAGERDCETLVDVIITVHNALPAIKMCVQSLELSEITTCSSHCPCTNVVLVDANSSVETATFLKSKEAENFKGLVYRYVKLNSSSYTHAVNKGIASGVAETVIVLNSDTVLPTSWISDLTSALYSSPFVGMVGPLSNSACYQSVPEVTPHHWSRNDFSKSVSVDDMNCAVKSHLPEYPYVPLLNGFAFAVRRNVVRKVGYFDEHLFPHGYGEENEYALRVRKAGFSLRIVDNLFLYHEKSASFGRARRSKLIRLAQNLYTKELAEYIRFAHEELFHHSSLLRKRSFIQQFLRKRKLCSNVNGQCV